MVGTSSTEGTAASDARALLRSELREQRAALTPQQLTRAAARFAQHCLPLLADARHVAGYLAVGGEMPVESVLGQCRARGAVSYAPKVHGETLRFVPFDAHTPLHTAHFGIRIPDVPDSLARDPLTIDVILVPLVGFDATGNRLGMGGGFYDRTFAARRGRAAAPLLIGCAHSLQQVDTVWPDWWDVPLDMIATDAGVIHRAT